MRKTLILFAVIAFILAGCAGKDGAMGPSGKDGRTTYVYVTNQVIVRTNLVHVSRICYETVITNCWSVNRSTNNFQNYLIYDANTLHSNVSVVWSDQKPTGWAGGIWAPYMDFEAQSNIMATNSYELTWPENVTITNERVIVK